MNPEPCELHHEPHETGNRRLHSKPTVTPSNAAQDARPRLIVICGPTAVGKTGVGIAVAGALNGEVISADSMQVYRGMDIGTAKPTAAERAAVPHHLIDVVAPDEPFDAARFTRLARPLVLALHAAGTVPVVVGGTGLYLKALLSGLFDAAPVDPEVRRRLAAEAQAAGVRRCTRAWERSIPRRPPGCTRTTGCASCARSRSTRPPAARCRRSSGSTGSGMPPSRRSRSGSRSSAGRSTSASTAGWTSWSPTASRRRFGA